MLRIEGIRWHLKFAFALMANVCRILVMTRCVMDGHNTGNCEGCESLYVIHLYLRIAKRRAAEGKGLVVSTAPPDREVQT